MSDREHTPWAAVQVATFDGEARGASFHASFSLVRGVYELRVLAPFNTQLAVDVLNPVIGFELQGDRDPDPHSYNSRVINPQDGTYAFEINTDKPVSGDQLTVRWNLLSHDLSAPATNPPPPGPPPPPPLPPSAPPSASPDQLNQDRYRRLGFEITGEGLVLFYWVSLVRRKQIHDMYISVNYGLAGSQDAHDPQRMMQRALYSLDPRTFPPTGEFELVSRTEPLPTAATARTTAEAYSSQYYGVPDQYGAVLPGVIKRGRDGRSFT